MRKNRGYPAKSGRHPAWRQHPKTGQYARIASYRRRRVVCADATDKDIPDTEPNTGHETLDRLPGTQGLSTLPALTHSVPGQKRRQAEGKGYQSERPVPGREHPYRYAPHQSPGPDDRTTPATVLPKHPGRYSSPVAVAIQKNGHHHTQGAGEILAKSSTWLTLRQPLPWQPDLSWGVCPKRVGRFPSGPQEKEPALA